jgi:hypothetical protein
MKVSTKSEVTRLKRKLPPEAYPDKQCKWCGAILVRTRHSLSAWKKKSTCGGSCSVNYFKQGCSKAEMPAEVDRFCGTCGALLVRKEHEQTTAWAKRLNCGKACAATGKIRERVKPAPAVVSEEERLGVKRYARGTPEFRAIAAQYGG